MDNRAARKARQRAIKTDLTQAYTDEEASPPEWLDIISELEDATRELTDILRVETELFVTDPDVRAALSRRERTAAKIRGRVDELNARIRRLNLIAPHARFTRPMLDAERLLLPLFRSARRPQPH
jgi:hypothetical protein